MFWLVLLLCVAGLLALVAFGPYVLAVIRLWFICLAIRFLTWSLFRSSRRRKS